MAVVNDGYRGIIFFDALARNKRNFLNFIDFSFNSRAKSKLAVPSFGIADVFLEDKQPILRLNNQ